MISSRYEKLREWKGSGDELVTKSGDVIKRMSPQELQQLEVCDAFKRYLVSEESGRTPGTARLPHVLTTGKEKKTRTKYRQIMTNGQGRNTIFVAK